MKTYPCNSFLIPDTFTADSSEWLVCSTENPGLQGKCSVGIGLGKRWTRLGTVWKMAAFLLFLKIVTKTVIFVTLLYSWLGSQVFSWRGSSWKMGEHYEPPTVTTMALGLSCCLVWDRAFLWANQELFLHTWLCLHLQFHP